MEDKPAISFRYVDSELKKTIPFEKIDIKTMTKINLYSVDVLSYRVRQNAIIDHFIVNFVREQF